MRFVEPGSIAKVSKSLDVNMHTTCFDRTYMSMYLEENCEEAFPEKVKAKVNISEVK